MKAHTKSNSCRKRELRASAGTKPQHSVPSLKDLCCRRLSEPFVAQLQRRQDTHRDFLLRQINALASFIKLDQPSKEACEFLFGLLQASYEEPDPVDPQDPVWVERLPQELLTYILGSRWKTCAACEREWTLIQSKPEGGIFDFGKKKKKRELKDSKVKARFEDAKRALALESFACKASEGYQIFGRVLSAYWLLAELPSISSCQDVMGALTTFEGAIMERIKAEGWPDLRKMFIQDFDDCVNALRFIFDHFADPCIKYRITVVDDGQGAIAWT